MKRLAIALSILIVLFTIVRSPSIYKNIETIIMYYNAQGVLDKVRQGDKSIVKVDLGGPGEFDTDSREEIAREFKALDDFTEEDYVAVPLIGDSEYSYLYINENYHSLQSYEVDGRRFEPKDFDPNTKVYSMIVGANRRDEYELGKEYTVYSGQGVDLRVKVIGVLKPGTVFRFTSDINAEMDDAAIFPYSRGLRNLVFAEDSFPVLTNYIYKPKGSGNLEEVFDIRNKGRKEKIEIKKLEDDFRSYEEEILIPMLIVTPTVILLALLSVVYLMSLVLASLKRRPTVKHLTEQEL